MFSAPPSRSGPPGPRHPLRPGLRLLLLAGPVVAVVLAGCTSGANNAAVAAPTTTTTTDPPPTTTTTTAPAVCPLTGAPPASGGVPQRAALAVKVDNYTSARPQSGLDKADVIFEEPVEGGITRYAAVFQCQTATSVGPVRSARNIDVGILGQLGTPILVHVGGIDPVIANINASPIMNFDLGSHGSVITNPPGRVAPYDTYTSTSAVWALYPKATTPPAPLFSYSPGPLPGTPVSSVSIPFSDTAPVVWQYNKQIGAFQRFYDGTPDALSDNVQNTAANVIVQFVQVTYGPWLENDQGGLEVQANLYDGASGQAMVFRGGTEISGTWQRSSLGQATQFTTSSGQTIPLQPGPTWVELVPSTITVAASP